MPSRDRTLHVHAGPHKTASTWIQAGLERNRGLLLRQGLRYDTPWREHSHRHLARQLLAGGAAALEHWLRARRGWDGDVLLSAEHLSRLIHGPEGLELLRRIAADEGWQLHVISFIRPQAALINSYYAHTLARLYASLAFADYVRLQCLGHWPRPRPAARRQWIRLQPLSLDPEQRFAAVLAAAGRGELRASFLPFPGGGVDPVQPLLQQLRIDGAGWRPPRWQDRNAPPGRRGLALALAVNRRLDGLGQRRSDLIQHHRLNHLAARIGTIARHRGWIQERFDGWTPELRQLVAATYDVANQRFARQVWGGDWTMDGPPVVQVGTDVEPALVIDSELEQLADALLARWQRRHHRMA
ncbi:MAG: hypothetical protein VKN13_02390 [Cyanobacteriota bacterium]|nr:hypothetical protein [Cyanobacteriota bacterium]